MKYIKHNLQQLFYILLLSQSIIGHESTPYKYLNDQQILQSLPMHYIQTMPYQQLLYGILENRYPYELCITNCTSSSPYALIKTNSSRTYIIGQPDESEMLNILQQLEQYNDLIIICDESLHTQFIQHGFQLQPRIELEYQADRIPKYQKVPDGYTLETLNLELFKQSEWFTGISKATGGAKHFLNTNFGFALVNQDGIAVAQAYCVFIGNGVCEIGIITHAQHRNKGYITYPTIATIQECLSRNLKPIWNCNADNIASLKTAHKLGFKIKRYYAFLVK